MTCLRQGHLPSRRFFVVGRFNPGGKFDGVVERGAQHDELDMWRTIHDGLFPDVAAVHVVDVMDLVHDDRRQFRLDVDLEREFGTIGSVYMMDQCVVQNLRRHNQEVGRRIRLDIAGA